MAVPGADLSGYLTSYPVEMTFGEDSPAEVFDRYHTPDYVVVSDGVPIDRQRMLDHVKPARRRVRAVTVDVAESLVDGDRVAARYVLAADMVNGPPVVTEVYMFGRLADDGRLRHAEQITRTR